MAFASGNAAWNRWFLAYGPKLQSNFMQYLGLPNARTMLLALTLGYRVPRQKAKKGRPQPPGGVIDNQSG